MSTNAISASDPTTLSTILGSAANGSHRHGGREAGDFGDGNAEGITLLASLLQAVIQNPSGSQTLGSNTRLSNLNSAFEKLVGDLRGGASSGSAAASGLSTSALRSFLTNLLQDLRNNGATSPSTLGSSVNTSA